MGIGRKNGFFRPVPKNRKKIQSLPHPETFARPFAQKKTSGSGRRKKSFQRKKEMP
jgi:hypothetical protein